MNRNIGRLMVAFLLIFAVGSVGAVVYQIMWANPAEACEKAHKWWDAKHRVCATPVLISDITGRTIQDKQAEAAALEAMGKAAPAETAPAR
ncbi:MAG: hypothetical protein WCY15_12230 [Phenylobacterium sp.]|jgi:hypothetical protein|uniref:hypothetical protein n=1 Tax=Phenylobacterium sp. TaxID=1871053 RepID=UPI002A2AFE68|nr:hypothetical protein [Phenylobacterium sp.]MDD3836326.1 hypothetical protein [Phenylobacterium sp.]MDX9997469.1 hypothetical protein [Phenylobacterium sp.]